MPFAVTCNRCGSRFALTDELYDRKVKGRVVTVRCKSCKNDISVDGVELASRPSNAAPAPKPELDADGTPTVPLAMPKRDEPSASGPISRSASAHPPAPGLWVVSYADTDDRELTLLQIERAIARREIDEQTLVWRDGMAEWLALGKIPELSEIAKRARGDQTGGLFGTGMSVPPPKPSKSPPRRESDDSETGAFRSAGAGTLFVDQQAPAPEPAKPRAKPELPKRAASPKPPEATTKSTLPKPPAPKKREIVPETPGVDEEPAPVSSGTPALQALTTELKKGGDKRDVDEEILSLGTGDASILGPPTIDLSSLTAAPPEVEDIELEPAPPSSRAATKPPREARARSEPPAPPVRRPVVHEERRGSFVPWLVLAAAAAVAVWWFAFRPKPVLETPPPEPTATPDPTASEPVPTTAETVPPAPSASGAPAPSAAPTAAPLAPTGAPTVTRETKPPEAPTAPKPPEPPTSAKEPEKEVPLAAPFDKGAASAALGAAAGRASSCRKEGDPSGTATVIVTFAPSGRVTSAVVSGPPFAGTATGGCIASTLRGASVPPFSGDKVTVSKTVVIN